MNDFWSKILAALMIAGVLAGATAVVAVAKLETKVEYQDKAIDRIYKKVDDIHRHFKLEKAR